MEVKSSFALFFNTLPSSGSSRIMSMKFLASLRVMCGGKGGTFGSVYASRTTGRSAVNASSQAAPTRSGSLTKIPFNPL